MGLWRFPIADCRYRLKLSEVKHTPMLVDCLEIQLQVRWPVSRDLMCRLEGMGHVVQIHFSGCHCRPVVQIVGWSEHVQRMDLLAGSEVDWVEKVDSQLEVESVGSHCHRQMS